MQRPKQTETIGQRDFSSLDLQKEDGPTAGTNLELSSPNSIPARTSGGNFHRILCKHGDIVKKFKKTKHKNVAGRTVSGANQTHPGGCYPSNCRYTRTDNNTPAIFESDNSDQLISSQFSVFQCGHWNRKPKPPSNSVLRRSRENQYRKL